FELATSCFHRGGKNGKHPEQVICFWLFSIQSDSFYLRRQRPLLPEEKQNPAEIAGTPSQCCANRFFPDNVKRQSQINIHDVCSLLRYFECRLHRVCLR